MGPPTLLRTRGSNITSESEKCARSLGLRLLRHSRSSGKRRRCGVERARASPFRAFPSKSKSVGPPFAGAPSDGIRTPTSLSYLRDLDLEDDGSMREVEPEPLRRARSEREAKSMMAALRAAKARRWWKTQMASIHVRGRRCHPLSFGGGNNPPWMLSPECQPVSRSCNQ
jgi:hypothetical protein